jgi:hypothetical protein
MSLRWFVDELSCRRIAGWIDDDGPAVVEISVNGRVVATILPIEYRKDLEDSGIGDGRRSFVFPITRYLINQNNIVTIKHDEEVLASEILHPPNEEAKIAAIVRSGDFSPTQNKKIMFLQTADTVKYKTMLQITSRTIMEYCSIHGLSCELFLGICRGVYPWHATFNRIVLLRQLLIGGFSGWVGYLDADAFIADLDFDIKAYLADKDHLAIIIATDNPSHPDRPYWAINSGTFFINLGNPVGREIVWQWAEKLDDITEEKWPVFFDWSFGDQGMLSDILKILPNGSKYVLTLYDEPNLINYSGGTFIRQILRADLPFSERQDLLRSATDRVLGLG